MAASFSSLVSPLSKDSVLNNLLALLKKAKFPTTSWASTSVPRALLEVFAQALAEYSGTVSNIARGAFLSFASKGWLDLLAQEFFGISRRPAVSTEGQIHVIDNGGGPHTLTIGATWFEYNGKRFVVTGLPDGPTVPLVGSINVIVKAESPGSAYNLANFADIVPVSSLPTVNVQNAPLGSTGTWIITQGVDEESDDSLRQRCREQWGIIGAGVKAAYAYHAKQASVDITKVRVYEATPSGGKVTVYIAGPDGAVSSSAVATVLAYFKDGRVPLCVEPFVYSVTNAPAHINGKLWITAAKKASALAALADVLKQYERDIDIGGTILVSELVQRVMEIDGVVNYQPTDDALVPLAAGDEFALSPHQYAKFQLGTAFSTVEV